MAAILVALSTAIVDARSDPRPWRVVILDSSDPSEPVAQGFGQAIREALGAETARRIEFYSEFLDTLRFAGTSYEEEFVALLRHKYELRPADLVVTVYPEALEFVERHRHELWPETPTVYVGVPDDLPRWVSPTSHVTGVRTHVDVAGTLALALTLRPGARHVAVVTGIAPFDRLWRERVSDALQAYADRLDVSYLDGVDASDLADRLGRQPPDAFVMYSTAFRTVSGPTTPIDMARAVASASNVPVFSLFEPTMGTGVLGGSMISLGGEAVRAGRLARDIFRGRRPSELAIDPSPASTPRVDYRQLRRFGMRERDLPPGTQVMFRPASIWTEYRRTAVTALVVLALQSALIAALLMERRHRRRAEFRSQQQSVELAHASRLATVGEITASIAHQINQPLGAILSNADAADLLLDAEPPPLDEIRQILADIRRDDARAHEVIQGMRGLLRRRPFEVAPVALNDVIALVVQVVQGEARRIGATLQVDLEKDLPLVHGDRVHLQQVLLNLVMNGLEATAGRDPAEVSVRTAAGAGEIHVEVADTGPGLSADQLPRIFESFFTTKRDGMGLGLSIARSLVEMHGGRISAKNLTSGGALFTVSLPTIHATPGQLRPLPDGVAPLELTG